MLALAVILLSALPPGPLLAQVSEDSVEASGKARSLRPVVGGYRGMVASNHPQASMAGIEILMQGGNAFDAAITVGAALGVVEPDVSGAGGIGWLLLYDAASGERHVLNFGGRTPAALRPAHFGDALASRGALSVLVPGSAAAWEALASRFGTMTPRQLLAPAIHLAEMGYPLTRRGEGSHASVQRFFLDWDGLGAAAWWEGAYQPPRIGDRVRNPRLATTYRTLAEQGFSAFYHDEIAREIAAIIQRSGGVLTEQDLADYRITWEQPIRSTYRGHEILSVAPNSSGGLATLQILSILEGYDVSDLGLNTAEYIHLMVEATKLAAEDRVRWVGDPDFMEESIPIDELLSPEYIAQLRTSIDPSQAATSRIMGPSQVGTTYYSVVDRQGNMVSVTTTLGGSFGSGLVAGNTGVVLNNGVSTWYDLDSSGLVLVEGAKRPRSNMAPILIARDGVPFLVLGTPGGTGIWQTQPQLITKLLDFELDIQHAIESPRFRWRLGTTTIQPESRIPTSVMDRLRELGHQVEPLPEWTSAVGGMNAIMRDHQTGLLRGGADPRRDGYVIGW